MPYTLRSKNLPSYVKKLPPDMRKRWIAIFNSVFSKQGEQMAFIVANSWLKRTLRQRALAARTKRIRDIVYFKVDRKKELIKRTESGEDFISFKLANIGYDSQGKNWTAPILRKWADQINSGDIVLGDVDHKEFESLVQAMYSEDEVKERIKQKPSIAKAVKAVFDNGALWLKAIIDKRYRRLIENSKGVSLEAIVDTDDIGNVLSGDLLGFTFGVNEDPVIEGTEVHYHGAS